MVSSIQVVVMFRHMLHLQIFSEHLLNICRFFYDKAICNVCIGSLALMAFLCRIYAGFLQIERPLLVSLLLVILLFCAVYLQPVLCCHLVEIIYIELAS